MADPVTEEIEESLRAVYARVLARRAEAARTLAQGPKTSSRRKVVQSTKDNPVGFPSEEVRDPKPLRKVSRVAQKQINQPERSSPNAASVAPSKTSATLTTSKTKKVTKVNAKGASEELANSTSLTQRTNSTLNSLDAPEMKQATEQLSSAPLVEHQRQVDLTASNSSLASASESKPKKKASKVTRAEASAILQISPSLVSNTETLQQRAPEGERDQKGKIKTYPQKDLHHSSSRMNGEETAHSLTEVDSSSADVSRKERSKKAEKIFASMKKSPPAPITGGDVIMGGEEEPSHLREQSENNPTLTTAEDSRIFATDRIQVLAFVMEGSTVADDA
jgi:hypothetical protein